MKGRRCRKAQRPGGAEVTLIAREVQRGSDSREKKTEGRRGAENRKRLREEVETETQESGPAKQGENSKTIETRANIALTHVQKARKKQTQKRVQL